MVSFGATCSDPFEVPGEAPSRKGEYVGIKVSEFGAYLQKELEILGQQGITYAIAYDFLKTSIGRIKLFISAGAPFVPKSKDAKDFSPVDIKKFRQQRSEYLSRVAEIIQGRANSYDPLDGSFWESVGEELNKLAKTIKARKGTKEKTKV